jgi:hypothetical protein
MFTIYIVHMCLTHGLFTVCVSVAQTLHTFNFNKKVEAQIVRPRILGGSPKRGGSSS